MALHNQISSFKKKTPTLKHNRWFVLMLQNRKICSGGRNGGDKQDGIWFQF